MDLTIDKPPFGLHYKNLWFFLTPAIFLFYCLMANLYGTVALFCFWCLLVVYMFTLQDTFYITYKIMKQTRIFLTDRMKHTNQQAF